MRKYGIVCPIRKPNPYKRMSKAIQENNYAPNLINRNFNELRDYIDEYIYYYNYERPQMKLEKTTPVKYRDCLLGS